MAVKSGVDVIIRDLSTNPKCIHGPTILFSVKNSNEKYFACSGERSLNCFYLQFDEFNDDSIENNSNAAQIVPLNKRTSFQQVLELDPENRIYCKSCQIFVESTKNHQTHDIVQSISNEFLKEPSLFLIQLDNDKKEAQYFFDLPTLNFLYSMFDSLKLSNIICIGAPRLHDYIKSKNVKQTILLDIDKRFQSFNDPEQFCYYNMFNDYFFNSDKWKLEKFLLDEDPVRSSHCIFTDPPFAARTELLVETIRNFANLYNQLNKSYKILPVIWIFPYYMEHYILKYMPEMEMLDFHVSYMNHKSYNDNYKGRKEGTPVRIFTNINPSIIRYPKSNTNYRYCKECRRYVSKTNLHCRVCKICPSKNGATYKHCKKCILCVKPNYIHCNKCERCVQKTNHECQQYQKYQECWICNERGHVEKYCKLKCIKKSFGGCLLCGDKKCKHNLKCCPKRKELLNNEL